MSTRREFMKSVPILTAAAFIPGTAAVLNADTQTKPSDFTLWQIPLHQNPSQGNSYVFRTSGGKVVVFDGGVAPEAGYLRGFLGALGNKVEAWFLSHPHSDHIGAMNEILKNPDGIEIKTIYHSEFSKEFYEKVEPGCRSLTEEFYANLKKCRSEVVDFKEPGEVITIDKTQFKILGVKNEEFTANAYNNSCMIIRVSDAVRSGVFLGDAGLEQGDKLLKGPFRKELDCDFLQLAHHGQRGVSKDFYRTIKFNACLWPTPLWLYNNDAGNGYDTHTWETVEIRKLMDELGIQKHYRAWENLWVVE